MPIEVSMNMTSDTALDERIGRFLEKRIPPEHLREAQEFVGRFCFNGQMAISSLLVFAEDAGKFNEALQLCEPVWKRHWMYQHPEMRGDPEIQPGNAERLTGLYHQLKIKPPWVV